jgi:hypothetical protein
MVVLAGSVPATSPTSSSPRADHLDLLILADGALQRLELHVHVDGKSVPAIWDDTFARLLAFCDRDSNGWLNQAEAARLPSAFALRQTLWGQFSPFTGMGPAWDDLDANSDARLTLSELSDYYRRAGLGNVLVGIGRPATTGELDRALLKRLDTNRDGTVAEAEWKEADRILGDLDENEDELLGPGELVERLVYPGALGSILLAAPKPDGKVDPLVESFPLVVLPLRLADTEWVRCVAARQEKDRAPTPPDPTLADLRKQPPAIAWQVAFGAGPKEAGQLTLLGKPATKTGSLRHQTGRIQLHLRSDPGKLAQATATARKRYLSHFEECDTNRDNQLESGELIAPRMAALVPLVRLADRNNDEKLSEQEMITWLDLQAQIARGHVLLTVLDHSQGLFEFLDADHDGSLSLRELRTAAGRLRKTGALAAGKFDAGRLPHQLLASVSRGHPQSNPGPVRRTGPAWFLAMDRNRDGDVSRKEFTGPLDVFGTLDKNQDGLLDSSEAEQATQRKP